MIQHEYELRGGTDADCAHLASLFAAAGLVRPDTHQPLGEALVLGIGGGLGIGYILWEFQAHHSRVLVLGMRNQWQYPRRMPEKLARRLNLKLTIHESGGARAARAALDAAIAKGRPAMLWVDASHLPWQHLPGWMDGMWWRTIVAYGSDADGLHIDDLSARSFLLTHEELAAARARIPSFKNRMLTVDGVGEIDLEAALRAGLADCANHLAQPSDSFSLPAIRKWARLMTDARHPKGWPRVFADGRGIYSALTSIFDAVTEYGSGGGSLRRLYADFVEESASVLGLAELREVASLYRWLSLRWSSLGEAALPTELPELARAKELITRRQMLLAAQGSEAQSELAGIAGELESLRTACDARFPLQAAATQRLFAQLQAELGAIYAAEAEANRALRQVAAPWSETG